ISMAGHAIGLHSWSHKYADIYSSLEAWKTDIETERIWIESVTGKTPKVIRLPGGVANSTATPALMKQILAEIEAEDLTLCAWNVDGTDSVNQYISAYEIVRRVLTGSRGKDTVVVLLHDYDTRTATAAALPTLIEAFRSRGYEFRTFE
ncbi:MAG TPA: polysaccharide deacetylase family protein, partial [Oscillospiraceae bacterium]|nr:polysaccharide deacetylase family protein [Oscillospiraceae bacterium]